MGILKLFSEKFLVQFSQTGPFVFTAFSRGDGAEITRSQLGVISAFISDPVGKVLPQIFRTDNFNVEIFNIMADDQTGFFQIGGKFIQYFL